MECGTIGTVKDLKGNWPSMKFEHLIQINDLQREDAVVLTRDQLWKGLILRAESPELFIEHLDQCDVVDRSADTLHRVLHYGELVIKDHVTLLPLIHVHYQVPKQGEVPASHMRMTIEEPEAQSLFVRFEYDIQDNMEETEENKMYNDFRRSAYQQADMDTVRIIRELVEQGNIA